MTLSRRRFLAVVASFAATPLAAQPHSWTGRAFGADVAIRLDGPKAETADALRAAKALIAQVEQTFSLYDPDSELSRLNASGAGDMSGMFGHVMRLADAAHQATRGLFDPTVQPIWQALAAGQSVSDAHRHVGWDRVRVEGRRVRIGAGQALTFNGIAQGYATDLVSEMLTRRGFAQTLVNIGEYRGVAGPWRLGLEDPAHGVLAMRTLRTGAVATSSPLATPIGAGGHILHPVAQPRWSTVSVEAGTAAMADALSTGLVLAPMDVVKTVRHRRDVHRITLVDQNGDLITL